MGRWHIVKQGEWLAKIAAMYWIADSKIIWDHPDNAGIKAQRDPNLLFPGDRLFIPNRPPVMSKTGEKHTFVLELHPPDTVRVKLLSPDGKPVRNKKFQARIGSQEFSGESTGDGEVVLENLTLAGLHEGTLEFPDLKFAVAVTIGQLNPAHKKTPADTPEYDDGISGIQMRLANLGFDPGPSSGVLDARTREALRAFQHLKMNRPKDEATGGLDNETRDAVIAAYGS